MECNDSVAHINPSLEANEAGTSVYSSPFVPQLETYGITERDLATAIKVLDAMASLDPKHKNGRKRKLQSDDNDRESTQDEEEDGLSQFKRPNLRAFRKSLASCLSLHLQLIYDGKSEKEFYEQRLSDRTLKRQKMAERAQQRKYVAATHLRKGRVEKLEKLKENCKDEEEAKLLDYLVPDGHVELNSAQNGLLENGDAESSKKLSSNTVMEPIQNSSKNDREKILPNLRSCYTCKVRFRILHHFYDQLCPDCAIFNFEKRHQTADMSNVVAVVTGSRVKIGFQVCLKLLRAGAIVIATTRFPNNSVAAYRCEPDFDQWKDRLHIYGLDLRDVTGLEAFTRYLKVLYGERGIDVLINNACQTVRRPGRYYLPLVEKERELWTNRDDVHWKMLAGCVNFERIRRRLVVESANEIDKSNGLKLLSADLDSEMNLEIAQEASSHMLTIHNKSTDKSGISFEAMGISHSAAMSQIAVVPEDVGINEKVMPFGLADINGQQLDLRTTNSWLLKMDQVTTPEIMECMFINAIAPFVLNSRLKPLMEAPVNDPTRPDRYIINVSAMEGKFYRYKMPNHPHTNMAKAALNMLTRTSAEELAQKSRIFMNSVDTGWINDENPLEKAGKIAKTNLFQTPLDEVDAAARILDPVFVGVNMDKNTFSSEKHIKDYGKFLKDYKETEW